MVVVDVVFSFELSELVEFVVVLFELEKFTNIEYWPNSVTAGFVPSTIDAITLYSPSDTTAPLEFFPSQDFVIVSELLLETIKLEKQLPDATIRTKVLGLTLVVANRIVDKKLLDEIWEEVRMLKIMQYAEEKGLEKGREEGLEKGLEKGREEGLEKGMEIGLEKGRGKGKLSVIKRMLFKKFGMLPDELNHRLDTLDEIMLDELSLAILDMQQLDDLKKFFPVS